MLEIETVCSIVRSLNPCFVFAKMLYENYGEHDDDYINDKINKISNEIRQLIFELVNTINDKTVVENSDDIERHSCHIKECSSLINSLKKPSYRKKIIKSYHSCFVDFQNGEDKHAYIYLIREREHYLLNQQVYKHGKTKVKQPCLYLPRLQHYKKESQLVVVREVSIDLVHDIEYTITRRFAEIFQCHSDGHEYFMGDAQAMTKEINKIIDAAEEQKLYTVLKTQTPSNQDGAK